MSHTISAKAFADIFKHSTPLLDVRSPTEFRRGAFQHASNLPLLDDAEREAVGTHYRQRGREAAIALGHKLLSDDHRRRRLSAWQAYLEQHPSALLYCFRGGLRSQTVQQWLGQENISVSRIEGGYKALRRFLISSLDRIATAADFLIVAGKTGSGKTHLLNQLSNSIDLEAIAHHRGSAFGRRARPQPSQIDFENNLAAALINLPAASASRVFIEDESRGIGSVSLPQSLHTGMLAAPIAVVEESLDSRVDTILNDYIVSNYHEFKREGHADFDAVFENFLLTSLARIQKRLGSENYETIASLMRDALQIQAQAGGFDSHRLWIESLLQNYYDPMYDYQLDKKLQRVVFRGDKQEFLNWSASVGAAAKDPSA
jgi:tRNA 2-selenouridine synthase